MLEKIKSLRGILFRKVTEEKPPPIEYPHFSIKPSDKVIEFPVVTDIKKINITYPLLEPYVYANIKWDDKINEIIYTVIEPKIEDDEKEILKKIEKALVDFIEVGFTGTNEVKTLDYIEEQFKKVLFEYKFYISQEQYIRFMYYVYRDFIGFNEIEPLLQDRNIEDISCDGLNTPVFIVHRKYGSLRTNISYNDVENLRQFIVKLAERTGKYVSYAEPILDATLPDGSRVAATLASDVSTRGSTFTIRKFGERPFSPIEQIELRTASAEIMAYLWYLVDHSASMFIVGGVSTGKTSFLNSVSMFIPPESKIVSIEDTREIKIPHQHWIAGLSRTGFGIPSASGENYGEVSLFDLLKESFRQNPDYVIVGEVRGEEAYVMFQGMSSGHPSLSTFHAGSVETVIKRLTTPPINLPPTLLESMDVVVIMVHARQLQKSARRIKEIYEIVSVDPRTSEVKTNLVYRWNPVTDAYEKVSDSVKIGKLAVSKGSDEETAKKEIELRKKILDWMLANKMEDYIQVTNIINEYYKDSKKVLARVGEQPLAVQTQTKPQPTAPTEERFETKKASVLDLLGWKMVKEK